VSEEGPPGLQRIVLYRCATPTDVLCPCGAVARRLARLGLEHRTERVPYRRARRPEIEELTRQARVPVLVDGSEVIHDSKRIIEYLEWRYGKPAADAKPEEAERRAAKEGGSRARGTRLYNLKRWRHRRQQSS
jgi:glutathione S-transferase